MGGPKRSTVGQQRVSLAESRRPKHIFFVSGVTLLYELVKKLEGPETGTAKTERKAKKTTSLAMGPVHSSWTNL